MERRKEEVGGREGKNCRRGMGDKEGEKRVSGMESEKREEKRGRDGKKVG